MKKILLPTDGSENAVRAGKIAILTAELDTYIVMLYVIDADHLNTIRQWDLKKKLKEELIDEGEKAIISFKKLIEDRKTQGQYKNVKFISLIKEGKPAEVILKTIDEEGIDQVIMGKSGKQGLEKFFVGSTTEKVVRDSNVPVNVIS